MTTHIRIGSLIRRLDTPPAVHAWDLTGQSNLSNTSFQTGTPEVGVNFSAPASGRVMAIVGGGLRDNGGNESVVLGMEIFAGGDASGALVQGAGSSNQWTNAAHNTSNYQYGSRITVVPGGLDGLTDPLVPGGQYFARLMQRVSGGSSGDIFQRDLTICPVPLGHIYDGQGDGLPRSSDRPRMSHAYEWSTQFNVDAGSLDAPDAGDPEVEVTFVAPPSGRMLMVTSGGIRDNSGSNRLRLAPEVRRRDRDGPLVEHVSGENIWTMRGISNASTTTGAYQYLSRGAFIGEPATTPLIPGETYYSRLLMQGGGGTCDVFNRELLAIPLS